MNVVPTVNQPSFFTSVIRFFENIRTDESFHLASSTCFCWYMIDYYFKNTYSPKIHVYGFLTFWSGARNNNSLRDKMKRIVMYAELFACISILTVPVHKASFLERLLQ